MSTFKRGDVREDGFVFERYRIQNGVLREKWMSPRAVLANKKRQVLNYQRNKEKRRVQQRAWDAANKDWHKAYYSNRRLTHAAEIKANFQAWRMRNLDDQRAKSREWARKRRESDPLFRLIQSSRSRLRQALKGKKTARTMDYVGCSSIELAAHLEAQFKDGMTWGNYGKNGWHVDHVIPLVSALTEEELIPLLHYTNLQPLWAEENLSKGGKIDSPPLP